tara:strand:- start:403 stop:594 length:192 start_codon:yes stop_codon:yes gene_type:complete
MSKNQLIYKQAKHLVKSLPTNSTVYIHWDEQDNPLVLPTKQRGYGVVTSVSLASILNKQCWLG